MKLITIIRDDNMGHLRKENSMQGHSYVYAKTDWRKHLNQKYVKILSQF